MTRRRRWMPYPLKLAAVLVIALLSSGATISCGPGTSNDPAAPSVGRYEVYEITLTHPSAGLANPWEDVTVSVTVSSPSRSFTIGGFYYGPNTWKARIAPDQVGRWRWSARLSDRGGEQQAQGAFDVVDRGGAGFVQLNPANPLGLITSDGRAFHPIGYQHSLSDDTGNGTPFDEIGFDGGESSLCSADPRCLTVRRHDGSLRWSSWVTDLDGKASAFGRTGAGFNLYRWGVDNAAFTLFDRIEPAGNVYLEREGRWGDQLVATLRANGIRVFMTILGFSTPYAEHNVSGLEAVKRYARYVVDRYGAYVDFWELMNEVNHVPDSYASELADAIRQRDPYRHLISTSWEKPNLPAIEIIAPHWYVNEDELTSDAKVAEMVESRRTYGKPIIFGEQGNSHTNWDPRSALRYRLRSWAALFTGTGLISWDISGLKDPPSPPGALYIGPEERGYIKVLSRFAEQIGPEATPAPTSTSVGLRSYALTAADSSWAYVVNAASHTDPAIDAQLTISSPINGTAVFLSPANGSILGTAPVRIGTNVLALPPFTVDLALAISN